MRVGYGAYCALIGGGIAAYIKHLLAAMLARDPDLEAVLWYGYFRDKTLEFSDLGLPRTTYKTFKFPKKLLTKSWSWFGFPKAERLAGDVDLFHGMHFELPPAKRARLVLTVHDVIALRHPEYFPNPKTTPYNMKFLLPSSLKRAERVIVISESTKRDLVEFFPEVEDRVRVIYYGRSEALKRTDDPEAHKCCRTEFDLDGPYVFYPIGSLNERKNLPRTLEAFRIFLDRTGEKVTLALAGVGEFPKELNEQIEKLSLGENVRRFRYNSEIVLSNLLSAAEFAIYPSLYEGFGLPILEALSCGTPLVTSPISSIPEVAGDAALYADREDTEALADAFVKVFQSDELKKELSEKAVKQAEKFSWERAAGETLAVYRELVK